MSVHIMAVMIPISLLNGSVYICLVGGVESIQISSDVVRYIL